MSSSEMSPRAVAGLIARYENGTCAVTNPDDYWLRYLLAKLFDGTKAPEDLRNNSVAIVTFNFDRVVEWHWHEAVISMYGTSGSELEKRPQAGACFVKAKQREDVRWLLD